MHSLEPNRLIVVKTQDGCAPLDLRASCAGTPAERGKQAVPRPPLRFRAEAWRAETAAATGHRLRGGLIFLQSWSNLVE
jgi:hypothetical protein